ncbi:hypothetical protein DAPPUDRAFT_239045 [Daphnia pulex]|uniref:Uncharacterized protein n=1 Tax=Daphnia pulex TaxID=6669 RepID=E9G866_DAPPU|nr:hypothetical protein DAPPUDRAFT_239045 [Daphnia pulex]|eukprot:EFX84330.1 hypothetical protein DAPPUDRAFT_239045 [Daphnia pulex]
MCVRTRSSDWDKMPKICFVILMVMTLSLFYCDAQNDKGHLDGVKSFWGNLFNKGRSLMNIKARGDLVAVDKRQVKEINGSFIPEATSRSSSCAVASKSCSCASATGKCSCSTTSGCTCTVDPCVLGGTASSTGSSSSSGSSSSGSSSSGSSSSGSSSSGSSSSSSSGSSTSTSTSGTKTTTTSCVNCACTTTVCTNGVCGTPTSFTSTTGACG